MTMSRLRVLYVVKNYPQLSQTYIQSELRAVRPHCDVAIISTSTPNFPDPEAFPYRHVPNLDDVVAEARRFKPHVLHTHYLNHVPVVHRLPEMLGIPYTVRAHSFDCLPPGKPPAHLAEVAPLLNQDICRGVFVMPFALPILVDSAGVRGAKVHVTPPVVDVEQFFSRSRNEGGVMNTGACIPKKRMQDFLALAARRRDLAFDLYAIGHDVDAIERANMEQGGVITIRRPVPHSRMPAEYKQHRWMVYTACFEHKTVGWPMAIIEAWASGVVVMLARIRPDIDDYLGDAGYAYESLDEVADRLSAEPPEDIRQRGFERARELDVRRHLGELLAQWEAAGRAAHRGA